MKKLLSLVAIVGVMTTALITSLLVLDVITGYETREILIKIAGIFGITSISSVVILLIVGMNNDEEKCEKHNHHEHHSDHKHEEKE